MEVEYYCQIQNYNYQQIAIEFMERYANSSHMGIFLIGSYYDPNVLFTLHIHKGNSHQFFELIGPEQIKNKMAEFGISTIRYHNIIYSVQPVGKKSILITFHGSIDINGLTYHVISTFNLKMNHGSPRIFNQILEIFI